MGKLAFKVIDRRLHLSLYFVQHYLFLPPEETKSSAIWSLISPWDKSIITNIVGGIVKANLGLNPVIDGDIIRIVIPALTSERREQLIKQMHTVLEKYRVEVRQIRHEYIERLREQKRSGTISEDDEKRLQGEIQKQHDHYIEMIEVVGKTKEEQIREV